MRIKADLTLLLAAIIWGSAFVAQRYAAVHGGIYVFNGLRFLLGAIVVLPFTRIRKKPGLLNMLFAGVAGVLMFTGSALQQVGLRTTTAANAGFLTGLYVVFVPIILWLFWRERLRWVSWVAILLAVAGALLLSTGGETFSLHRGDVLEIACALFWALHLVVLSKFAPQMDVLQFSVLQNLVCGLLSLLLGVLVEQPSLNQIAGLWWSIAYTGVLSVGLGYTLQVAAQRHTPASDAALILSAETVLAALFGYLILGETLNLVQMLGCVLILVGILLTQFGNGKITPIRNQNLLEGR